MDFPAFNIVVNNAWHVYSYVLKMQLIIRIKRKKGSVITIPIYQFRI